MSRKVVDKIQKDIFKNNILSKMNRENKILVESQYDYNGDTEEYILKEGILEDVLDKIEFIFKRICFVPFESIEEISSFFRRLLHEKKYILLFAYNGTGKTRISSAFKDLGKRATTSADEPGHTTRDTLYYNAFTEDLFTWDNDLENDTQRVLKMNQNSHFFDGLPGLDMENRIRPFLSRYADFDFSIDDENWRVTFSRKIRKEDGTTEKIEQIKVSRGEENIFIWCFFLAVAQLAIDKHGAYNWVKYIYIDDPISSLDDNNAIAVASHLARLLKDQTDIKTVISTHHTLFFNVMYNELKTAEKYFLSRGSENGEYRIRNTGDTPFFHHVALLQELHEVAKSGNLYTYHFNILRNILEKTAVFHGFENFSACIKQEDDDLDGMIHTRMVNLLSHGDYSLFEPIEMNPDNKAHFKKTLKGFMEDYRFNPELFPEEEGAE